MADFYNLAFDSLNKVEIDAQWWEETRNNPFHPNSISEKTWVRESSLKRPQESHSNWDKDAVRGEEGPRVRLKIITFIW